MGRILGPSALRSRHRNAPRPVWKVEEAFRQWIRGRPCYLANHAAGGCGEGNPPRRTPIEAAHVNHAGDGGMGVKVSDRHCIPLCQRHHDEQHGKIGAFHSRGGWATFQLKYGFNAMQVAESYWRAWPGDKGDA